MDRPTRQIKTSGEHTVVLHDYITGREQRQIQEVFLKNVEINRLSQSNGKTDAGMSGFSAATVAEAQDLAFKLIIISMDGNSDDVVKRVLDLPAAEFEEIVAAVNEVTDPKKK
jgi:hypothetical protein